MKRPVCHKCEHNGKGHAQCLTCAATYPTESYRVHGSRLSDLTADRTPTRSTKGSAQVTPFPDETEDKLRKALNTVFRSLDRTERDLLGAIVNAQTLTDYVRDFNLYAAEQVVKPMTKCRAFAIRKRMLTKLGPGFAPILLTAGQRRELKSKSPPSKRSTASSSACPSRQ